MAKKHGASGAPIHQPAALTAVEEEAQEMMRANDEGEIDNVFDIFDDVSGIEERLPATSALRPAWDTFHGEMMESLEAAAKD